MPLTRHGSQRPKGKEQPVVELIVESNGETNVGVKTTGDVKAIVKANGDVNGDIVANSVNAIVDANGDIITTVNRPIADE